METTVEPKRKVEGAQFLRYFGPLLEALRSLGGSGTPEEVVERIALDLGLSDEAQDDPLPSGESRYRNQVAWARFYLVREGLVDSSKRGVWSLTERGRTTRLTLEQAKAIRSKWVRYFQEQRQSKVSAPESDIEQTEEAESPADADIDGKLIELLLKLPPAGFERLSQRLLREAGFTQVIVTGRAGDGGIDGWDTASQSPRLL
jgi:restriction system protein